MNLLNMTSATACGDQKPPGTEAEIYYTCTCELNGFPQTEAQLNSTNALGDLTKLAEAFDFTTAASGEGFWRKAKIRLDSGGISMGLAGKRTLQGKVRFAIDGTGAEEIDFAVRLRNSNECLIFAIRQFEADDMTIIGTVARPGMITTLNLDGGDGPETENGTGYEITSNAPLHIYDDATFGIDIIPNP